VSLDVGTDNAALLADELYVGWRRPRLRGEAYDTLVDEFVRAVARRFPGALLQWEDFRKSTAFALLERYRSTLPSFNDDIQGTAAMALAGLLAGARATGTRLEEQRTVILGGGAAGIGIARLLHAALGRAGLPLEDRLRAVAVVDLDGLLVGDAPTLEPFQRTVAWPAAVADASGLGAGRRRDLAAVVRAVRATALIGVSGATGAFTNDVVRELAAHCERPLVFALSNPTSLAEAQPADVIAWTDGRALVATGSPFGPVAHAGRLHRIGQGNNAFVFPGVGLGVLVSQAREVTDEMFLAAAAALAGEVADEDVAAGALFPPMRDLRRVTARIAEAVVRRARDAGVGRVIDDAALPAAVEDAMWTPAYPPMEPA
jgi:malic enzyme